MIVYYFGSFLIIFGNALWFVYATPKIENGVFFYFSFSALLLFTSVMIIKKGYNIFIKKEGV